MSRGRNDIFYVYLDLTADDNTPFYVGKGTYSRVHNYTQRNDVWFRIVKKYGVNRIVLLGTYDEAFAHEEEIRLIREHKTYRPKGMHKTHWGANLTAGGEGTSGYKDSPETIARKSAATLGANNPMYGKHHSNEAKRKIADKATGRKRSAESIAKTTHHGEDHQSAILTQNQVDEIRAKWVAKTHNQIELASAYGVERTSIGSIVRNKNWKSTDYIPPPSIKRPLKDSQVRQIRKDHLEGLSNKFNASKNGVGPNTVHRIVNGLMYKDII